jgi:hypothetical protein
MAASIYLGLLHYPIYNRNQEIITTAITNFDIHDIARTSRTYGLKKYFIINPLQSQLDLATEILAYWQTGVGSEYNSDRKEAFSILQTVTDLNSVVQMISDEEGQSPTIITTDAQKFSNSVSYSKLRTIIAEGDKPCLLLFGTGWGIERSLVGSFDYILEPIYGCSDYNHLPVRSAVAIILDRLLGEVWWEHK